MTDLLSVEDLHIHYPLNTGFLKKKCFVKAVSNVSFTVQPGEVVGIVGESGCGKSTLARGIAGLTPLTAGKILFKGDDLSQEGVLKAHRHDIQMIFQDPLAALDPRMTIGESIAEPLQRVSTSVKQQKVVDMLQKVGLSTLMMHRYPHELSGGQCQRVGIARALITEPSLIICDEVVSALDVSIQAQMINLLMDLQQDLKLTLLFIAHDLAVVKHIADRIMVMYLGHVVEMADKTALFDHPKHPYTKALLDAVPVMDPKLARSQHQQMLEGELPSPVNLPLGCVFHTRCPLAEQRCREQSPVLSSEPHQYACLQVEA